MKTFLIIDTHALLHRFYHAMPPLTSKIGEPVGALYGLAGILLKILAPQDGGSSPDYIAAALDRPEKTFRSENYPEYKLNRPKTDDALIHQLRRVPELFEQFGVSALSVAGFEADDIIGTLVELFKTESDLRIVILSGDRDLLQLVSNDRIVVNILKTGMSTTELCDEACVIGRFGIAPLQLVDYKGLVGDPSDNIPGVSGIGPKAATELLKEFKNLEGIYENFGLIKRSVAEKLDRDRKQAFLSRELATIRRDVPLDSSLKLHGFKCPSLNVAAITPYFQSLGFQSFLDRYR